MARSQPDLFRQQALACDDLGSPMYADLFEHLADDLEAGGPTARVLQGHEDDPGPSALALRLAGGVHRLVLAGEAAELAGFYPSAGGTWSGDRGVAAVVAFLADRGEEVRPLLDQPPQTNEVGRSAALLGGLLRLVDAAPLPVRLFEIGSSGGLNLQADLFRFVTADPVDPAHAAWGPEDSPVVLDPAWRGDPVPVSAPLEVVERGGSDVSPVDVTTDDGSLTLRSYVWPDQTARHERLAGAIALARGRPTHVERADAASYVDRLRLEPGTLTVLWHSVMWQYVPADQQARVTARLEELGEEASSETRLAHVYAEPVRREPGERHRFLVCAHTWPGGGRRRVLGAMEPHGPPVTWE
jgi:hypothetical protein